MTLSRSLGVLLIISICMLPIGFTLAEVFYQDKCGLILMATGCLLSLIIIIILFIL